MKISNFKADGKSIQRWELLKQLWVDRANTAYPEPWDELLAKQREQAQEVAKAIQEAQDTGESVSER